jgi:type IV secretion system protein VirB9
MKKLLMGTVTLILATGLHAQNSPVSFPTDSRIKHVVYQDNNVVPIHGMTFTTTQIQFGEKEEVLDIEGGDSTAWMVTYHPELSNTVFVKPTILDSSTNLTVITNRHVYYFHLTSNKKMERNPAQQTYAIKFIYQPVNNLSKSATKQLPTKTNPLVHPKALNSAYRFSGSPQLVPLHVFDDGKFTYFELSPNGAVPAIFAVDDRSGKESTVNTRREGKYLIVQRIAPQFTLRQGRLATSVFNTQEINRIAANRRPQ